VCSKISQEKQRTIVHSKFCVMGCLYGVFGRAPDAPGLGDWVSALDNGFSLQSVADSFLASPEFKAHYGSPLTNGSYVEQLYENFLNRSAEASGYDAWVGALDAGLLDRSDVLIAFSRSPEYQDLIAGDIANGILFDVWWQ
ncbi:DUF4214 domain-containing protein, partial [Thiorhodococcus fuscus]